MIAIIDYGMGNLRSVEKGIARTGFPTVVTSDAKVIHGARGVVLPGVGAFGACMENLRSRGLIEPIRSLVGSGKPFLGICLGLQLLFEESEEFGPIRGLGILPGRVVRFGEAALGGRKIPQIGWNSLRIRRPVAELEGIDQGAYVYFVHSYYVVPAEDDLTVASSEYGVEFTAAIARQNVFACQFHPEKSQTVGLKILENFVGRVRASS
ncbi:MAG: imidazole glycerol phosphate synthase subunit HisH [Candidatus Binatia bacterium]